jgi:hypothetical protein
MIRAMSELQGRYSRRQQVLPGVRYGSSRMPFQLAILCWVLAPEAVRQHSHFADERRELIDQLLRCSVIVNTDNPWMRFEIGSHRVSGGANFSKQ